MQIQKVLIANRGEISRRIQRTLRRMGLCSVAVYSEIDSNHLFVQEADEAICIGAPDSYQDASKIIQAAKQVQAQAIHPGYGFLSESLQFAKECAQSQIAFIGPGLLAMEKMASKGEARNFLKPHGIPFLTGECPDDQSMESLYKLALEIGLPVMLKASAGGGGKGMVLVQSPDELQDGIKRAKEQGLRLFGDGTLVVEKAMCNARHVEVQVISDQLGNHRHLGLRDCSLQRRSQKIIEECPPFMLDECIQEEMIQCALKICELCDYEGAGTIEFLVEPGLGYFFLEMNTRLQVEHPVSEEVYSKDLVEWQIRVARGEELFPREEVQKKGHSIEVRVCAEDISQGFLGQVGRIKELSYETMEGIRVESGFQTGDEISPFYDSMLLKLISWGENREVAREKLSAFLRMFRVYGIKSNQDLLIKLLNWEQFERGEHHTRSLEENLNDLLSLSSEELRMHKFFHTLSWFLHRSSSYLKLNELFCFHSFAPQFSRLSFKLFEKTERTSLCMQSGGEVFSGRIKLSDDSSNEPIPFRLKNLQSNSCTVELENQSSKLKFSVCDQELRFYAGAFSSTSYLSVGIEGASQEERDLNRIVSPVGGNLLEVCTKSGQSVNKGEVLFRVEAMKMEHLVKAPRDGEVEEVCLEPGNYIKRGDLVVLLTKPSI